MLNYKLYAQGSFTPTAPVSPDAITPEQVLRYHRSAQGRHGGTGLCPLLRSYQHLEFHIHGKGILQRRIFRIYGITFIMIHVTKNQDTKEVAEPVPMVRCVQDR